jgi:hypothetical protein
METVAFKSEERDVDMDVNMDTHPYSTSHSPVEHLLCPPKALVECMFPDALVFPVSLLKPRLRSGSFLSTTSKLSVEALFEALCKGGLYSHEDQMWTAIANAPDFKDEHVKDTECRFAAFLERLVEKTVELIDAKPEEVRTWSARHDKGPMPGCFEQRKPDIFVTRKEVPIDWRTVDCVVELKNGAKGNDRDSLGQIAERARTLFNVQDTRRYGYIPDCTYLQCSIELLLGSPSCFE